MALIIEDGSRVTGANSFVTVAEARTYAATRGITTLPAADADVAVLLILACDYLLSLEDQYKGFRVTDTQALSWPRERVYLFTNRTLFSDAAIPQQLKDAQCQLCIEAIDNNLQATGDGREVKVEEVDVIKTEYFQSGSGTQQAIFNKALAILAPCLNNSEFILSSVRV